MTLHWSMRDLHRISHVVLMCHVILQFLYDVFTNSRNSKQYCYNPSKKKQYCYSQLWLICFSLMTNANSPFHAHNLKINLKSEMRGQSNSTLIRYHHRKLNFNCYWMFFKLSSIPSQNIDIIQALVPSLLNFEVMHVR